MIRALDRLAWGLNLLGTLLVAALAALICADVIGRAALDLPIRGVAELASLAIVTLVFLQLPHAVAKGRMIRSEMLLGALMARAPRAGGLAEAAFRLVGAAFFGAVAWAVWPELLTAWERGTYVGASGDFTRADLAQARRGDAGRRARLGALRYRRGTGAGGPGLGPH